jgi:type I restriction enzyme R subunit
MRIAVKKILRKHGYPPDLEKKAADTVIQQAKLMAEDLSSVSYLFAEDDFSMAAED